MADGRLDLGAVDEAYKRLRSKTGGGKFWRPEKGSNRIRILPFEDKDGNVHLYYEKDVHFLGQGKPEECRGMDCPYCQKANELKASSDKGDRERGKKIAAKTQYKMNIIDRNVPEAEQKVVLYDACATVAKAAIKLVKNPEYGPDTFCYGKEGRDILIEFDSSLPPAEMYDVQPASKQSAVPDELVQQVVDLQGTDGKMEAESDTKRETLASSEEGAKSEEGLPKCFGFFDGGETACKACKVAQECEGETPK